MSAPNIAFLDFDERRFTDPDYLTNCGPFSYIAQHINDQLMSMNAGGREGYASHFGVCDGLNLNYKHPRGETFFYNVWETSSTLPTFFIQSAYKNKLKLFGLSNQITNLWQKYGVPCKTIYPGIDGEFWKQTKPKSEIFTFLHINSSSVRSGIELSLLAYHIAFRHMKDVRLIVKDTNRNPKFLTFIKELQDDGSNIELITERVSYSDIRDLYSISHVCLNLLRSTSFGLPLCESSACNCLCVTGDTSPTNEIINEDNGVLVRPTQEISIREQSYFSSNKYGLHNAYPDLDYPEEPKFYDFNVNEYADIISNIYHKWSHYKMIETRSQIINKFQWSKTAAEFVKELS